jgi:GntR family transcriptional regulator
MRQIINRTSKLPLYQQLYEILRSNIVSGEWQPGNMIPPESELTERYQVSRTTVRQVLDMLVSEGLIEREQGRGTFVAHPTVEQGLVRIVNFTEDMRMRGCEPSSKVLFSGLIPAPQDIAEKLHIEPGEELARLERLRLADGEPMGVEESYLVHRYCPGILQGDYVSNSLREALERHAWRCSSSSGSPIRRKMYRSSFCAYTIELTVTSCTTNCRDKGSKLSMQSRST